MQQRAGKLTDRQRKFAELYLQLGNASEAAVRAGFKRSYAQAAKKQPAVQAYMQQRLRYAHQEEIASTEEILAFLTDVMRGAYDGEKPKKAFSPRTRAAVMLGRHLGLAVDANGIPKTKEKPRLS